MKKSVFFTSSFIFSLLSYQQVLALEILTDHDMAAQIGQDGLTVQINTPSATVGTITFDEFALTDYDGLSTNTNYNQGAVLSYKTIDSNTGISFYSKSGTTYNPITTPIEAVIDADGNNGAPTLNLALRLNQNLSRINLNKFQISVYALGSNNVPIMTNERILLKSGSEGINIDFVENNPFALNLQLGSQPQGALFKFTGGSITNITANDLQIMSYPCSSACSADNKNKMSMDLSLSATNQANGFRLAGIIMDPTTDGLVIYKEGTLDKFNVKLSNIVIGELGAASNNPPPPNPNNSDPAPRYPAIFNDLKNGAIGNVGLEGIAVKDFKMTVKGL